MVLCEWDAGLNQRQYRKETSRSKVAGIHNCDCRWPLEANKRSTQNHERIRIMKQSPRANARPAFQSNSSRFSLPATRSTARIAALTAGHFDHALPTSLLDCCCRFLQLLFGDNPIASRNLHLVVTWRVDARRVVDESLFAPALARKANVFAFDNVLGFRHLLHIGDDFADAIEFAASTSGTRVKQRTCPALRTGNQTQHYRQRNVLHDRFRYSMPPGHDQSTSTKTCPCRIAVLQLVSGSSARRTNPAFAGDVKRNISTNLTVMSSLSVQSVRSDQVESGPADFAVRRSAEFPAAIPGEQSA